MRIKTFTLINFIHSFYSFYSHLFHRRHTHNERYPITRHMEIKRENIQSFSHPCVLFFFFFFQYKSENMIDISIQEVSKRVRFMMNIISHSLSLSLLIFVFFFIQHFLIIARRILWEFVEFVRVIRMTSI